MIELAITRDVPIRHACCTGAVDAVVRPGPIELSIVTIAGPCTIVLAMAIRTDVPRVGYRYMTDDVERLHIGGIAVVVPDDDVAHGGDRGGAAHIRTQHDPSIGAEIEGQLLKFGGQLGA